MRGLGGASMACPNDSRAFMIVMYGLTAFLCVMVGRSVHMVYNHTPPAPAQQYSDTVPAVPVDAVVDGVGYDYVGTCRFLERDDGGHGDSLCDSGSHEINSMCRPYLHQRFPQAVGDPSDVSGRRLSDDETLPEEEEGGEEVGGNVSGSAEARRLRGGHGHSTSCYNRYAPWLRVNFTVGGVALQRCSYRYGTKANSQTMNWNFVRDLQENRAIGDRIDVWPSNISGNCIVVQENATIFDTYIDEFTHDKERIVPLFFLFFCCGGVTLVQMVRWIFCLPDPPEGEDAKKKPEEEDEEEEEEEDEESE